MQDDRGHTTALAGCFLSKKEHGKFYVPSADHVVFTFIISETLKRMF